MENDYLHIKFYNNRLKGYARRLRKNSTLSEVILWSKVLSKKRLLGLQFNRQKPLLNYIVDFICKEEKIIVEIDGVTHNEKKTRDNDFKRQMELESLGFKVIRFSDAEVLFNLEGVKTSLEKFIIENRNAPPPDHLKEGE